MTAADPHPTVTAAQDEFHVAGHDYENRPPHVRHAQIRSAVVRDLTGLVREARQRTGACQAIEIGAGHGTFTDTLVRAGARVTVTEASRASAEVIEQRFAGNPDVTVVFDETGESALDAVEGYDLAVCISVLHHIPDYLSFIDRLIDGLAEGGAFYSVQDPMRYSTMPASVHQAHHATYLLWRLGQGNYRRGLATRVRRMRGVYNDSPADLVEYHVVRDGVDQDAIETLLRARFEHVQMFTYWSTQSPTFERLGERAGFKTTFGFSARGKLAGPGSSGQPA